MFKKQLPEFTEISWKILKTQIKEYMFGNFNPEIVYQGCNICPKKNDLLWNKVSFPFIAWWES